MNWPATPPNYPRVHVTPAGDLFFSGWQRQAHLLDPQTLRWTYDVALTRYGATRRYGSSVLLALRPPEYTAAILIAGGGVSGSATNSAEVIDVSRNPLQWNQTGALDYARVQHTAVLLPNGRVLAVGGSKTNNVADANGGGRFSEIYDRRVRFGRPRAAGGCASHAAQQAIGRRRRRSSRLPRRAFALTPPTRSPRLPSAPI